MKKCLEYLSSIGAWPGGDRIANAQASAKKSRGNSIESSAIETHSLIGGDMPFQSQEAFLKQAELIKKFGEGNAYLLWSLSMHLDNGDIDELAAEALTDQPNDKKIDF